MLIDFQRALAELTASPSMCRQVRAAPQMLRDRYDLTDKEWRRLVGIVASKGMEANCILYRANRLAPVALNLPNTCTALGADLNRLISAYWESAPTTDVHFLIEADRFCRFLLTQPDLPAVARTELEREHAIVVAKLAISRSVAKSASGGQDAADGDTSVPRRRLRARHSRREHRARSRQTIRFPEMTQE